MSQAVFYGVPAFILNTLLLPFICITVFFDMIVHAFLWKRRGEDPKDFIKYLFSFPIILILATVFVLYDCVVLSVANCDTVFFWQAIEYEEA